MRRPGSVYFWRACTARLEIAAPLLVLCAVLAASALCDSEVARCRETFARKLGKPREWYNLSALRTAAHYHVFEDLALFTGLDSEALSERIRRKSVYGVDQEHAFWNPRSTGELAWFYASSVTYLFNVAVHRPVRPVKSFVPGNGPVLDFAGGAGSNTIALAKRDVEVHYISINSLEEAFVRFRLNRRMLSDLVTFLDPRSARSGGRLDAVAALPGDGSYGAILAIDVLEHMPHYKRAVRRMVLSLRPGGVFLENTPFAEESANPDEDFRIHLSLGNVTMAAAMGPSMKVIKGISFDAYGRAWRKAGGDAILQKQIWPSL